MRRVKARVKYADHLHPAEYCCDQARSLMEDQCGMEIEVDLDDITPYFGVGHCGQQLPYTNSVMAWLGDESAGYVPMELIDIDKESVV